MVVRFLPTPEERATPRREEREDLAEVIEFRTRLRRPEPPIDVVSESAAEISPAPTLQEELDEPIPVDGGRTAQQSAVKLLARKPLSSGELRRELVQLGHSEGDAEGAVASCEVSLYIDDEDLARSVTRKLRESKGESRSRIRQKLRERLLPNAAIEVALEELDEADEMVLLRQTAEDRAKRMVGLDRQVAERRLLGYLARRGWSGDRAATAVREALDGSQGAASRRSGSGSGVRFS